MTFVYQRTIRFRDTDAAGVMYFANALAICHEAYEESLAQMGINLEIFFGRADVAIPITHASIDFRHPVVCGEGIRVELSPFGLTADSFEIIYRMYGRETRPILLAQALTRHVCISRSDRKRVFLPDQMLEWLQIYSQEAIAE